MSNSVHTSERALKRLKRRKRGETIFRGAGLTAISFSVLALGWLLVSIFASGLSAFTQHNLHVDVVLTESVLDPDGARDPAALRKANFRKIVQDTMYTLVPEATDRKAKAKAFAIASSSGATNSLRQLVYNDPSQVGETVRIVLPVSDEVDQYLKGKIDRDVPEELRKISNAQIEWVEALKDNRVIRSGFNWTLFSATDSRDPELAGVASAFVGSALTMLVTLLMAFPIGVGAAVYLEEYAPKNRFTEFIEININNLAAVPSIVFGLLGLAVFLNTFGLPRSSPLVGGMVLALMTFPIIIITTRASLKAVPAGIYKGALSLGASHTQAVFHHKLPLAAPGILTGSIIGMAQALGETAPLLMIGMVAFVTEVPSSLTDPASALPVQIFLWSDSAEQAWNERTSAAIMILLAVLLSINAFAIWLRQRLERRW